MVTDYNGRGFKSFAVDHSGGALNTGTPTFGGNGDIHDSYTFVKGGITPATVCAGLGYAEGGVSDALEAFRMGTAQAHEDKKIAVEKVDIVTHSYGGLLSRWYIEQAGDYQDDVAIVLCQGAV